MSGFIDFLDGNILDEAGLDTMMRQGVMRFPTTAAISANLGSGIRETGMRAWADSTGIEYMWNGSVWVPKESADWNNYSAAFTSGGVNFTLGNGSVVSRWRYSGGQLKVFWKLTVGSTTSFTAGAYAWALPKVIESNEATSSPLGWCQFYRPSTTAWHERIVASSNSTNCVAVDLSSTRMSTTVPLAVTTADIITMRLEYYSSTDQFS